MVFKRFILSRAQESLLFCGAEQFVQFWLKTLKVTILWNYFNFGLVVQEQMMFKDISYLELWRSFYSVERKSICTILIGDILRNNSEDLF